MTNFIIGFYVCGAVFTFVRLMFFAMLGGDASDLPKPFWMAMIWPITIYMIITRRW